MKKSVLVKSCIILIMINFFLAGCQTDDLGNTIRQLPDYFKPKPIDFETIAKQYVRYLALGTSNLLQSLSEMQEAVGNKELAEQIRLQAEDLQNKSAKGESTKEDYKKAFRTMDESSVDREQLSKVPTKEGRIYLTKSLTHVGLGTGWNGKAVELGVILAKNASWKKFLEKSDVYNDLALLSVDTLPQKMKKAYEWGDELRQYMKDNNIEVPTEQEQRKEAENQGATQEEIDEIFG